MPIASYNTTYLLFLIIFFLLFIVYLSSWNISSMRVGTLDCLDQQRIFSSKNSSWHRVTLGKHLLLSKCLLC